MYPVPAPLGAALVVAGGSDELEDEEAAGPSFTESRSQGTRSQKGEFRGHTLNLADITTEISNTLPSIRSAMVNTE